MAMFIVTGNYTAKAIKGMLANPSDREAAVRPLVEGAGGKLVSLMLTTGDTDFSLVVETDDIGGLIASLIVAGASETVLNLKTQQAFTSAEFLKMQNRAGDLSAKFTPAG